VPSVARNAKKTPVVILGLFSALGPLTIDSYLPALPQLADDLAAPLAAVDGTLAATMLGFALGQLAVGPWSDAVGRKVPLVCGLLTLLLSSVGAMLAADIVELIALRFAQGLGAASAIVTALAIARDEHSGGRLARVIGTIALVSSLAPLIAPVVGSVLLTFLSWRGIFAFSAACATAGLVLASTVRSPSIPFRWRRRTTFRRFGHLLADAAFAGLLTLAALRFTALFSFLQWAPFIFQSHFGLSASGFGILFAVLTVGMMVGLQISPRLLAHGIPAGRVLWGSCAVLAVSGGTLVAIPAAATSPVWVAVACGLFLLGCGLGLPTIQTLALEGHPHDAGTAAGLIGASGFGCAAVMSPLVNLLPAAGLAETLSLGVVIVAATIGTALVLTIRGSGQRAAHARTEDL